MGAKRTKKKPRKFILKIYNLVDKLKFKLKIKPNDDLIIVSGADSSHFRPLSQFIRSALHYEFDSKIVIYDLGLIKEQSDSIKNNVPQVNLKVFDYYKYPSYLNIKVDAGQIAWKPVIISDVLNDFKSSVIWLDAGCLITQPLYQIRNVIKKHGFYSPVSKGTIKEWTHPKTLKYLNVENDLLNKRNLSGGAVAIDFKCSKALSLIKKWKEYALIKECIAPEGSNRKNHRRDQSILTILAYQFGFAQKIPQRRLGFQVHQDVD